MNHAGEISPLVKMVRPHIAIITTVQPVHLEFFESVEKIAQAKAEIFDGLEPGGIAILNKDNHQYDLLRFLAATAGVSYVQTFGEDPSADSHTENVVGYAGGTSIDASILGTEITYKIGAPGRHLVKNSLAVLTAVRDVGADLAKAGLALDTMRPPKGRGQVSLLQLPEGELSLIDESYNANPASMRAALQVLGEAPVTRPGRRIAVIGDMSYAYRHSAAPKDLVFTSAVFAGIPQDEASIRQEMADVVAHREKAQPIREKTGGSTFKNPPGTSAWKEVDAAGCRGLTVGGAQMSEMHCNFMV